MNETQIDPAAAAAGGGFITIIYLAVIVLMIAALWKVFTKAGKPGWAAIIPIYNMIVLLEIAGKPIWWFILFFVPIVGLVIGILVYLALVENFGKGAGFAVGLIFLPFIFLPILGFGDAQYQGAASAPAAPPVAPPPEA